MTDIVKLNASEYGLDETKAQQIASQFQPMLDKMIELEKEFNEIAKLPIEEKSTSLKAKELRLKYVKVRTGTAEIHKQQKAFYLAGGRFVDGWKNAQLFASQGIEEKLEEIEKYAENLERQRIAQLQSEREGALMQYEVENISSLNLGSMSDDVWKSFLLGTKSTYEAKKEAERKAEEDRLEQLRKEAEEREAQKIENERLRKEAEEREKQIAEERRINEEKLRAEREENERKLAEERKKAEEERKKIEAEQAELLRVEREKQAKIQAELKAKEDAERAECERLEKIEKDRIEAEKKAQKAPDKIKLTELISKFESIEMPTVKSEEAKKIIENILILRGKLTTFIAENSNKL